VRSAAINRLKLRLILAALLATLASCGPPADRVLEETFEQLYTIEPTANVTIRNRNGAILVYGSNVNQMRVRAIKRAYTRQRLRRIVVDVSVQQGSISIDTRFPAKKKWGLFDRSGTVDYTIVIPASATISQLNLDAGEVLLDGLRGPAARAQLGDGRMFAHNCFTDFDLAMHHGTLTLSYDWWEQRKFSAKAHIAQGNAWAFLPTAAAFHLFAETPHGKIVNDFDNTDTSPFTKVPKIDMLVNGGGQATIKMHVINGNIKIVEANP
jgi:hypothetical protein